MNAQRTAILLAGIVFACSTCAMSIASENAESTQFLSYEQLPDLPDSLGVAEPFVGVHNDALIVAGGANFPIPVWENDKQWHDNIYVLSKSSGDNNYKWIDAGQLDKPIAYGASVSTKYGVVCIGGSDSKQAYDDVFLLKWDPIEQKIAIELLPALPGPCSYTAAALIGDTIYVAGGQSSNDPTTTMKNFWSLDLAGYDASDTENEPAWKVLPSWPGPSRAFNLTVAQHNGSADCIYVISGRRQDGQGNDELLKDVYEFNPDAVDDPQANPWRRRTDSPQCVMAGPAIDVGQSHIFVLGGDDGENFGKADQLKDDHPGFFKNALAYHTITDTWITAGPLPQNHVTTTAVKWDGSIIIATGEIRPRVRSPKIYSATLISSTKALGTTSLAGIINYGTIVIYLLAMVAIGIFFSKRNKNTDDFFRGGKRVPWPVAGLSIFATMLSSITFMAIPAKAFATDWVYLAGHTMILAITPFVVYLILPFFRRIDATSAYEYLEKRFNIVLRLFASASFVFFQVGRMAIVMFLPAIALATITPFEVWHCIVAMGILSIIYCTFGGFEAVVWTDAAQSVVLLGGAVLSFILIVTSLDGGIGEFVTVASQSQKFNFANLDFDATSFTTTALWVVVVGAIGQNMVSYTSDQAVIQRYVSTSDQKKAAKAIWLNGLMALPAGILFFAMGTALFVFYKTNPAKLDPTFQTDAIFPLFISRQLPAPIAGIVIAGIFAAAQSTISTSMNSTATAIVTDFVRRFDMLSSERAYLNTARILTIILGLAGTILALMFASGDIKSLWDQFLTVIGLFGGSMGGLFLLGIFTKRASSTGAVIGAIAGALAIYTIKTYTDTHLLLYATAGITACFLTGYAVSLVTPQKSRSLTGLTIYTLDKNEIK